MKKTFYITTPIYYPSGKFHIGTAYCTTLVDSIKRYKELRGYDAYMLTGLDEHGQKIQTKAEENNVSPQEFVDDMAKKAKDLWKLMDISYDDFIRTTDERHVKSVTKIVEKFLENGDIYKGMYEDWYCIPCENYFTETLAKIYVKQQRYDKALEIIKKLNLKYPKKNAYFADQIRFLEKLIINAKSK